MKFIDKYRFILTLSNETELSVDEATELINKIPFKYLEMAINKYKHIVIINNLKGGYFYA